MAEKNRIQQIAKRIEKTIDSYEKRLFAQTPSSYQAEIWQETKSRLRSGIQDIIDAAQPPYVMNKYSRPVILICTPEIVYLPANMGTLANIITTGDGGGLADISAALVAELDRQGVNVHVTLPEYRNLFQELGNITNKEYELLRSNIDDHGRIHPITDDIFKIAQKVYDDSSAGLDHVNLRRSTSFMRGIISRLLPKIKAQHRHVLVHSNDWMTGLIPAAARSMRMQSLMTFHNIFTMHQQPSGLRKHSIDIAPFWRHLVFDDKPGKMFRSYEQLMKKNPYADFMSSGLYAADVINTVSKTFLKEMVEGYFNEYNIMSENMRSIIIERNNEGRATGIRNAPPHLADPKVDKLIKQNYSDQPDPLKGIADVRTGKKINKNAFQEKMGLAVDEHAPVFFWPSRIARPQKGFDLLIEIIPEVMRAYEGEGLQVAVVANGEKELIKQFKQFENSYSGRICYKNFDRTLSQLGIAGADFVLMPSLYEPCGTPQVVGQLYGTPPVVRKTGGLADTVKHLSNNGIDGGGFVFEEYNPEGLMFGIREAMSFYRKGEDFRCRVLSRIIRESSRKFTIQDTARQYIDLYEEIFERAGHKIKVV